MSEILSNIRSLDMANYIGVEDFSDRLSFLITTCLLSAFCTIVTVRTYFLHPLSCFIPNQFGVGSDGQVSFVNNYCWTEGTYAVQPQKFRINNTKHDGGMSEYRNWKIVYYQWVPFVLGVQAVMCCLPRLLWQTLHCDRSGTEVGHIIRILREAAESDEEKREKLVSHGCRLLLRILQASRKRGFFTCTFGPLSGSWLIVTYFIIKLAYLINAVAQLVAMQRFLQIQGDRYKLLGLGLLLDILNGRDWQNTMVFPRVGCCAVFMRAASHGNWQYSQCSLPINMINEKIYIFLWFWFVFVAIATAISLVAWTFRLFNAGIASRFVTKYLSLADNYEQLKRTSHTRRFVRHFLGREGTFVLKMVAINCGDAACAEIIQGMWTAYKQQLLDSNSTHQEGMFRLNCEQLPLKAQRRRRSAPWRRKHSRQGSVPSDNDVFLASSDKCKAVSIT